MASQLFGLLDTTGFPARWHCGRWSAQLGWLHILSDLAIFGAYMAIPVVLVSFIRHRRDLPKPFPIVFWLFGAFIVACGTTHLIEAVIFWHPVYRFAGVVKAATAGVSWLTLAFLVPAVPKALMLRTPDELKRQVAEATNQLRRERDAVAHLAAIVESSQDAILSQNLTGCIQSWNRGAIRIFGYSLEEIVGRSFEVLVPEPERAALTAALTRGHRGEATEQLVSEWIRKDRTRVAVAVTISPFWNQGAVAGLSMIVRDISVLQAKTAELERSNEELEQFAYVASHDLQEPLRMVVSFMDLLKRSHASALDEMGLKYVDFAVDGASRMKQLIDALLVYSRVDARGGDFERVSLKAAFENVIRSIPLLVQESGAHITCEEELPEVLGDSAQLEQVLQNLISNAIKFRAERPPEIRVRCADRATCWEVSVQDNGIGFEPRHADRIFQMFQRVHDRTTYAGSGIGLAIARRIISRHGGRIWATAVVGQGAVIRFTLPKKPALEAPEGMHAQAIQ